MIPIISEHDTWISLDPVIGCPADCSYCFVQKFHKTHTRPEARIPAEEAVKALHKYLNEEKTIYTSPSPGFGAGLRIVCLGNYTDMFISRQNRQYALTYAKLHHDAFPFIPLVFITKGVLNDEVVDSLDALGHTILVFISQSFLSNFKHPGLYFERGVASPEESLANLRLLAASSHLKPIHFWRPLTRINLPEEKVAINQLNSIRDAGAIASVAVGLKLGDFLLSKFTDTTHPLHSILSEQRRNDAPEGEIFPPDLREIALYAGVKAGHPVYLNTSCAVSLALEIPEFLETWRPPIRELRCDPANCPEKQRYRCFQQKSRIPTEHQLRYISKLLLIPIDAVQWDAATDTILVNASLSQDMQCRLAHLTGSRVQPLALSRTREWIGSFCGIGKRMNQAGAEIDLTEEISGFKLLHPLILRHERITGLLTPFGPPDDHRGLIFSRFFHIRRVATVAVGLAVRVAQAGGTVDVARVRRLAWLHDLNRWPFAHNSERGLYDQIADLPYYFQNRTLSLNDYDLGDLINIHLKELDKLSIEGLIVCAADRGTGITEDIFFAVTALKFPFTFIPSDIAENLGIPLFEDAFQKQLSAIGSLFENPSSIEEYRLSIDRIVTGHADSFIARFCNRWDNFQLGRTFFDIVTNGAKDFLRPVLFPIINDKIGKGMLLRERIILPLIENLGPDYSRALTLLDDYETIELAIRHRVLSQNQLRDLYPNFDYVSNNPI